MDVRIRRTKEPETVLKLGPEGVFFSEDNPNRIGYDTAIVGKGPKIYIHPILSIPEECPGLYEEGFVRALKSEILADLEVKLKKEVETVVSRTGIEFATYMLDDTPDGEYQEKMDKLKTQFRALKAALLFVGEMRTQYQNEQKGNVLAEQNDHSGNVER
jgi:hypothetical protein